jgi:phage-related protein
MEDAAAQDQLANNLRRATGATEQQIAANEDWISTQGTLLGITDSELRPVLAKLARATGDVTKAQQFANQAMDIAASTGKPLATVTDAIAKAMGGNLTALAKLAPEYRAMIKDGADFETVMSLIADTTGGAATEAANTAQGQFKRLGVALDETKESIGAALLPAVQAVLPFLTKFGDWAAKHPEILLAVGAAIAAIAVSIMAVNLAMALNPFSLIAIGVIAVGAALVTAYNKFEGFRNIVDSVFGAMRFWINNVTIPALNGLLAVFKTVFNGMAMLWNNSIGRLSFKFPSFVPGFGGKGFDVPNIPMLANGGIVKASPGGTLALIGEGGQDEAVIPLNRMGSMGGGVTINVNGGDPQAVVDALVRYSRQNGSLPAQVKLAS